MTKCINHNKLGFSLIEVALALLVVSVGLVAAIGLLPGTLDNSKKASDDTQQALFADYVLNSVRAYATLTNKYAWEDFILRPDSIQMSAAADSMWASPESLRIVADGNTHTLLFRPAADSKIEEVSIVYNLELTPKTPTNIITATLTTYISSALNTASRRTYMAKIYRGDLPYKRVTP